MPIKNRGFSMIELMIVLAIIGILAAIAIPNLLRFNLRSKSYEAKVNIWDIRAAEELFFKEYGTYMPTEASSTEVPGTQMMDWPAWVEGFKPLNWRPENGKVFFQYKVAVTEDGQGFTIEAVADIDGDKQVQRRAFVKPSPKDGSRAVALSEECSRIPAGMIVPCDYEDPAGSRYGRSIF